MSSARRSAGGSGTRKVASSANKDANNFMSPVPTKGEYQYVSSQYIPYRPTEQGQAVGMVERAMKDFKEQIDDDDSIEEGEFIFEVFKMPANETESIAFARKFEED